MKNHIFLFVFSFLICFFQQSLSAQKKIEDTAIESKIWADDSPQTLAPKRKVWSLLGTKKMGASRNMEWYIKPLFFWVSPNLGLKKYWKKTNSGLHLASFHQINYPSIYLNMIASEGVGGVLPANSQIPPMLSLKNEVLLGFNPRNNHISLRAGLITAFKLSSAEKNFPDIDFPFLYNRTLALNHSPTLYVGINYNRDILPKWNLEADFAAFQVAFENNNFVFENKVVVFWKKSDKFGLKAGLAAAYGTYPYGFDFRMLPVFDVLFGFGGNKTK